MDLPRQQKLPYALWPAVITGVHAGAAAIGRTADRGGRAGAALVRELSAMRVEISESGREGPACDLCGPGELPFVLIGPGGPWQKSSRIGNAGETACATVANQQFAAQVGQAFSLPGLLPRAARGRIADLGPAEA